MSLINLPGDRADHDDHPGIPVRLGALFHIQPGLRANAPEEPLQHGPLTSALVASVASQEKLVIPRWKQVTPWRKMGETF